MHICVNELSFRGQLGSPQEASDAMKLLVELLKRLVPIQGMDPLCTAETLGERELTPGYTVSNWMFSNAIPLQERLAIIIIAKNGPFARPLIEEAGIICDCKLNGESIAFTSPAAAAHFLGLLVSLLKHPQFERSEVGIECCADGSTCNIGNVWTVEGAGGLRRVFNQIDKHRRGGHGTEMDLDDATSQTVLDEGIMYKTRVYGLHDGQFYNFMQESYLVFHGYPVTDQEVPWAVRRELVKRAMRARN